MTSIFDGVLAVLIAVILNVVVALLIRSRAAPGEARFLASVYTWAVLVRYGLAIVLNALVTDSAFAATFWGDSGTYDIFGYQLARKWSGEPMSSVYAATAVSGYGWVYFVAMIYSVFGRNQLLVQLLNGAISGVTILVIYAIAAKLFDRNAARLAALFMAFFPQMIFWSAGMYKDPAVLLSIAVCMYSVLLLRERLSPSVVAQFILFELALMTLRFYVAYFVALAGLATFLFTQRRGALQSLLTYALLLTLSVGALSLAVRRETLERQSAFLTLERLQVTREDQATWAQSGYGQDFDVSTPAGALMALPVGLIYLLFAPFPWAISGVRQALVAPETLVWYSLMPAFVRGVAYTVRNRLRAALPILVFAATLTVAYALMQGNVGTAYRQRTQVTMFFFIFMGVGVAEKRRQREAELAARNLGAEPGRSLSLRPR
jgi:4-amino-4-deoxy-L-arabinose transferase-like glycosyltransferase